MNMLTVSATPVKPHVTIRRHVSGAWQPLYVDRRGASVLRIYIQRNDRRNVEAAVKFYALAKGFEYVAPVEPVQPPADFAAAVADLDAGLAYVTKGIDWAAVIDEPWG
jgi:hypothetical protein